MSISPQSLARTRDKRSLKVPARFNDTVYNEVHYAEATQVLRASTRSRPGSLGLKRDLEDEDAEEKEEVMKAMKASIAERKLSNQSKKQNKSKNIETTTAPTTTATLTTIATGTTTIASSNATPARPLAEQIPNSPTTPPPSATPSPISVTVAPLATKPAVSNTKKRSSSSSRKKSNGMSLIFKQPPSAVEKKQEDTRVRYQQLTQLPSMGSTLKGGASNFTIRHHHNQPIAPLTTTPIIPVIPGSPSSVAYTTLDQGAGRHFNSLTPNRQHYSTRILINEPIYLPRTVGTIAPITTSLPQFTNLIRRPPFVSKKAQAYLSYQDERKLNLLTSTHAALIRVAQQLSVKDRLNLRCVSRTWKSIVDCEAVWKRVVLRPGDEKLNLAKLVERLSKRYKTNEIYIDHYEPNQEGKTGDKIAFELIENSYLRRIHIKSITEKQNSIAFSIMASLKVPTGKSQNANIGCIAHKTPLVCEWHVGIGIDQTGLATVRLSAEDLDESVYLSFLERGFKEETSDIGEANFFSFEFHDLKEEVERIDDNFNDIFHGSITLDLRPM